MSDGWVEKVDKRSGKTYFYNKELKQTAWVKPTGSAAENSAWEMRVDKNTGEEFYYNKLLKIRSAVPPKIDNSTASPSLPSRVSTEFPQYENTNSRRHLSMKLGQLEQLVKDQAPQDSQFDKLRALRRNVPAEAGNTLDIALLAKRNRAKAKDNAQMKAVQKTYDEYAAFRFALKKKGMFSSGQTVEQVKVFSGKPLKKSLLGLKAPALEKRAVEMSKLVLKFCSGHCDNDPYLAYKTIYKFVELAMKDAPQELRDEAFCQLIRHQQKNPSEESRFKGWQMLILCCGNFPPSANLSPTLRWFLDDNYENLDTGRSVLTSLAVSLQDLEDQELSISELAHYGRLRLDKCLQVGARARPPSKMEVERVMARRPVTLSIFLINGLEIQMQVDTWTTVKDLIEELGKYLNINDVGIFSLVEVNEEDLREYVLPVEDRVLDVVADWELEYINSRNVDEASKNQFLFRIRLFLPIEEEDTRAIELAYYQAVYDVTDGRYPVSHEDISQLIAYQLQEKFGNKADLEEDPISTNQGLAEFLPSTIQEELGKLRTNINEYYHSLHNVSEMDAMQAYLKLVQSWPSYGCQIFAVSPLNNPDFPSTCYVAINSKAIYIIDPNTQKFITNYPWEKIVSWGYTDPNIGQENKKKKKKKENTFCLIMGNYMEQMKLFFETPQAIDAYRLIEAYGNRIKGYKK